jgi:DNA-binding NtrC family response regulator
MTKLYVVDDDWGFLEVVREVAGPMGFDTVLAAAPKEFKSLCECEADAVVMIDMVMPETDGIELMNWLSDQGFAGEVILVSGFTPQYTEMASALAKASGLKVADTLSKPVKLDRLRKTLAAARSAVSGKD